MASTEQDLIFWSNIGAGAAVFVYILLLWLQVRGILILSPRIKSLVRWVCVFMLLLPIAARYQYSNNAILYLSVGMCLVGVLIKLRRMSGM